MPEDVSETRPSELVPRARARRYEGSLHWDAREQTLVSYAATMLDFLKKLKPHSEVFERWFIQDAGGATPLKDPALTQLVKELEANRRTWEFDAVQYSGHDLMLTNARSADKRCDFELICGIREPSKGIWFANQLHFELRGASDVAPDVAFLEWFFCELVEDFSPAWATLVSPRMPERTLEQTYRGVPQVGWFTAFAPDYGAPPPVAGATVLPLPSGFHVLRVIDDWFDEKNPDHMARLQRQAEAVEQAGLMKTRV